MNKKLLALTCLMLALFAGMPCHINAQEANDERMINVFTLFSVAKPSYGSGTSNDGVETNGGVDYRRFYKPCVHNTGVCCTNTIEWGIASTCSWLLLSVCTQSVTGLDPSSVLCFAGYTQCNCFVGGCCCCFAVCTVCECYECVINTKNLKKNTPNSHPGQDGTSLLQVTGQSYNNTIRGLRGRIFPLPGGSRNRQDFWYRRL